MNGIKVNRKIKRVLIFFGCIMMISLLAICAVYAFWYREQVKITEFDVSLIQYELDYFPYDGGMYRPIEDGKEARQVVAMVLINLTISKALDTDRKFIMIPPTIYGGSDIINITIKWESILAVYTMWL